MYTSGIGAATKVGLGIVALLALLVAAMGALQARPATAADGDPVLVYGGSVSGSGAAAVNIAPNANGNYVVSMTVPAGEDIGGIQVDITYNQTLFSAVTCPEERNADNGAQYVCNPDADPSNSVGKVSIVAAKVVSEPAPGGWGAGTFMLATVNFVVANGAPNTANAITDVTISGCSPALQGEDVTCSESPANLRALSIGSAPSFPWGDVNCSGLVTSTDISIIVQVAAGGLRPGSCTMPTDLNCANGVTSTDISIVVFIAAGGIFNLPPACLVPLAYAPSAGQTSHYVMAQGASIWEAI